MTLRSIQLVKEIRQLLLPWTVTMLGGFVALFPVSRAGYSWSPVDLLSWILPLGCFVGIPLLAALPLGNEFQYQTLLLLLSQPIDRRSLWRQKMMITLAAVLPASTLYLFAFRRNLEFSDDFWMAAVWIVAATAGSIAGTLVARSTIGGLALSSAFYGLGFVAWSRMAESYRKNGEIPAVFLWSSAMVLACYAAVLVFAGRRMFLRFQPADGSYGPGYLTSGTRFLPRFATNWLRCRPHGAFLNLIRREFHLLRTVWFLALLSFFTWTCLILFHLVRPNNDEFERAPLPAGLAVILSLLIAFLAGSLSLGEEKNWGTHVWQLTLPMSPSTQWVVKLVFALCASLLCAVAIPLGVLITRGWISGSPLSYLDHTPLWVWTVEALVATLLAFWCSCSVKGTVSAVLWSLPMLFALGLAGVFGEWMGDGVIARLKPLVDVLESRVDPFRMNRGVLGVIGLTGHWWALLLAAPLLAAALIQSHRMFLAPTDHRKLHAVRNTFPLIAIMVFSTFLLATVASVAGQLRAEQTNVVRQAHLAIETLEASANQTDLPRMQRFTADDLAKATPLSSNAQHWLRDSAIVVRPEAATRTVSSLPAIQWPYELAFLADGAPGKKAVSYSATIRTPRGSECNLRFWAVAGGKNGFLFQSCQ
ncbi:MAG TPA: hypothetical protein VKT53_01490 [Candidatus Acidoferrum sp.]|nr:hypothetical protein [Candidatus Acidoferrum sp.]